MPRPPEGSKREKASKASTETNRDRLKRTGASLRMPPNPAPHLVEWLIEAGLCGSDGMGMQALSWRELEAWQAQTGRHLTPFEVKTLRKLSADYVAESRKAESETCPPPWRNEVTERERDHEVRSLKMVLG